MWHDYVCIRFIPIAYIIIALAFWVVSKLISQAEGMHAYYLLEIWYTYLKSYIIINISGKRYRINNPIENIENLNLKI